MTRTWAAWVAGSVFFFFAFVLRVSPSVMVTDLMRDFAVGASILGNLSAVYFYAYLSLQIPIGIMMDRLGPRRLMSGAALVCALGCVLFAYGPSLPVAYAGRLLIGAGAAFAYIGTLTIASQWMPIRRFALLGGLLQMFGMIGAIGGQAPIGVLVERVGWRSTMLTLAIGILLLALLLWILVRDRTSEVHRSQRLRDSLRQVAANRQTWLNAVVGFALSGPMLAFAGLWSVPYLETAYGLSRASAAATTSLYFLGWAIAAPLMGWSSDRVGRRKPFLIGGCLVLSAALLVLVLVDALPYLVLGGVLVLCGAAGATMVVTFANVKELNSRAVSGTAIGLVNMAVVGSGALLQPLIGQFLDAVWDGSMANGAPVYTSLMYSDAFLILPAIAVLGFIVSLFMRESFCRQID